MNIFGRGIFFIWLVFLCVTMSSSLVSAQSEMPADYADEALELRPFDRPTWQRATEGLDYFSSKSKERDQEAEAEASGSPTDQVEERQPQRKFQFDNPWLSILSKIILIVLGGIVCFILLRALLGMERKATRKTAEVEVALLVTDIEKIEENMETVDLEEYIQKALNEKRYDLAIRLFYLTVLKELSIRRLVRWKKGKTNDDYLRELKTRSYYERFRRLTQVFEQAWYSGHPVSEEDFSRTAPHFRQFLESLPPKSQGIV